MNHPGMAPVFADLKEISLGRYEGDLKFTMAGDWTIIVSGVLANGQKMMEQEIGVPNVRPE